MFRRRGCAGTLSRRATGEPLARAAARKRDRPADVWGSIGLPVDASRNETRAGSVSAILARPEYIRTTMAPTTRTGRVLSFAPSRRTFRRQTAILVRAS